VGVDCSFIKNTGRNVIWFVCQQSRTYFTWTCSILDATSYSHWTKRREVTHVRILITTSNLSV